MLSDNFLSASHTILKDEVPTKENGAIFQDNSGSSKFDETWPSTEQTNTTISPNVNGSSHSEFVLRSQVTPDLHDWLEKTKSRDTDQSKGTIAS